VAERTLVAGIGNIFLGDDGFGSAVVDALVQPDAPAPPRGVRVVDYGIRGMHLAYDLLDGWDRLVLVDALPDRGDPGRLAVLRIAAEDLSSGVIDAHGMDPGATLSALGPLGGTLPPTVLVGVQVADVQERMGLSPAVAAAVPAAVAAVQDLILGWSSAGAPSAGTPWVAAPGSASTWRVA